MWFALAPRLAVMQCRAGRVPATGRCHLYFARRVTFLSCADNFGPGEGDRDAITFRASVTCRQMPAHKSVISASGGKRRAWAWIGLGALLAGLCVGWFLFPVGDGFQRWLLGLGMWGMA